MRKDNRLNEEDRQVLNGLKVTFLYVVTVLVAGLIVVKVLELFIIP